MRPLPHRAAALLLIAALAAGCGGDDDPAVEDFVVGFRVASVPEPSTAVLVLMGVGALYLWKRRRATL